jgi:Nuclease-related domain/UvrD-like helicase C-terminal domain/AAA domain
MTKIIPPWGDLPAMTHGEKRLAARLEAHLDDEYLVWYDVPVGKKRQYPDFIVLHPEQGLLVLEVKDWKPATIVGFNPQQFELQVENNEIKAAKNPLEQARNYALAINQVLCQDESLVTPIGSKYQGKLILPYGYGVVLANITRAVFRKLQLGQVLPEHLTICSDEMYETVAGAEFRQRLSNMWEVRFSNKLNNRQIDRIRALIFPEIRMPSQQLLVFLAAHPLQTIDDLQPAQKRVVEKPVLAVNIPPDLMQVMDLKQERLARSLGDGHRVIHGVAGSGKTMILLYRAQYLAQQQPQKPILVLCFNLVLAAKLQESIQQQTDFAPVQVYSFFKWLKDQCRCHHIPVPTPQEYRADLIGSLKVLENRVILGIENGQIPMEQYSSVLIDEGHDLKGEWLRLLALMPENKSLLLLYDDAQNLYLQERKEKKFSFKSVGIEAIGRTKILNINYRNTNEVLGLAYRFAKESMAAANSGDEDLPVLLEPTSAGRHGAMPRLIQRKDLADEISCLSNVAIQAHERGMNWSEMAILCRTKAMAAAVAQGFADRQIPLSWLNKDAEARNYNPQAPSVKLVTMHSSKGLEFPLVMIPDLGCPVSSPEAEEVRLLYVAMTRSTNRLILTYHRENSLVRKLQAALALEQAPAEN